MDTPSVMKFIINSCFTHTGNIYTYIYIVHSATVDSHVIKCGSIMWLKPDSM